MAAWIVNNNNGGDAIEGGWYSGISGNGTFVSNLLPYYTINDDANPATDEIDGFGDSLHASTAYHLTTVESSHTQGYVEIGWNTPQDWRQLLNYDVPNGLNFSQGEVSDTADCTRNPCSWMGGGPYNLERMDGSYCNSGCTSWAPWSYIYTCYMVPYDVATYSTGYSYGAAGPNN